MRQYTLNRCIFNRCLFNRCQFNRCQFNRRLLNRILSKFTHSYIIPKDRLKISLKTIVKAGHLNLIIYLFNNHRDFTVFNRVKIMDYASIYGHLNIIKYVHYYMPQIYSNLMINSAINNNNIDIIEWLLDNRQEQYYVGSIISLIDKNDVWIKLLNKTTNKLLVEKCIYYMIKHNYIDAMKKLIKNKHSEYFKFAKEQAFDYDNSHRFQRTHNPSIYDYLNSLYFYA